MFLAPLLYAIHAVLTGRRDGADGRARRQARASAFRPGCSTMCSTSAGDPPAAAAAGRRGLCAALLRAVPLLHPQARPRRRRGARRATSPTTATVRRRARARRGLRRGARRRGATSTSVDACTTRLRLIVADIRRSTMPRSPRSARAASSVRRPTPRRSCSARSPISSPRKSATRWRRCRRGARRPSRRPIALPTLRRSRPTFSRHSVAPRTSVRCVCCTADSASRSPTRGRIDDSQLLLAAAHGAVSPSAGIYHILRG